MLTGCPWEEDTDVTPPHWRKISMQEVYASLNKVHGEGKIKQNCISAVPPPAPLWGITQSLDNYLLLEIVAPFSCPWNPLPGNWNCSGTPGAVSCADLCTENPGRYFVCAALNSPPLGEDQACWAHSWTFCKLCLLQASLACWDTSPQGHFTMERKNPVWELDLPV